MYKPLFNKVLVEIDDQDAKWGSGNNENLGGEAYREGKLIESNVTFPFVYGDLLLPDDLDPEEVINELHSLEGKTVMWNEGHEAGTVFEEDGKKYALVYWWDIIGVKE